MNPFFGQSIISIKDMEQKTLEMIFDTVDRMMAMPPERRREACRGRTLGYLFYEPSTRTRLSFEAAMASLGGNSLGLSDMAISSTSKGETLADTVRVMSAYADAIVLRHPLDGSSRFAAEVSSRPVINGGSGTEEHPTQALLDLYTMRRERSRINGLRVGVIGDLKHGRTVYSLLYGLSRYDIQLHLVSPESLRVRADSTYDIRKRIDFVETTELADCLSSLDVLYVTRIQRERFDDEEEYEKVRGSYVVGLDVLKHMKPDCMIMHPLPRLDEISPDVDGTPHARYFQQAEYGKHVRAALLHLLLNEGACDI